MRFLLLPLKNYHAFSRKREKIMFHFSLFTMPENLRRQRDHLEEMVQERTTSSGNFPGREFNRS